MSKNIIRISLLTLASFVAASTSAQDLMARQARMDKQLRAVDSVSLQMTIKKEVSISSYSPLYTTWTHDNVDCYQGQKKPLYYKIDLRDFSMPIGSRVVTSKYGYRPRFRRQHKGIDVKLYTGDTVYAAFSGRVRISGTGRGYGKYVVLRHPNGLETIYGHFSKLLVKEDEYVKSGEPIGLGGNTGNARGSHLHFETRLLGEPINPELLFDFANQDVTGDYYVYHNRNGVELAELIAQNKEKAGELADYVADDNAVASVVKEVEQNDKFEPAAYRKVKRGETLYSIAKEAGLTVGQLCQLNGLSTKARLRVGQILKCK